MVAQALLGGGGPGDGGEVLGHSPLKSAPRALGLAAGESGQGRRNNGTGFLGYSGRISPPDGVARLPCIWKENCSDQFISVDSKGSVAQCYCWVTSYPAFSAISTERAKNMAATNGFDQARINKENDRHNLVRGLVA
jgi:hypothetical protein